MSVEIIISKPPSVRVKAYAEFPSRRSLEARRRGDADCFQVASKMRFSPSLLRGEIFLLLGRFGKIVLGLMIWARGKNYDGHSNLRGGLPWILREKCC